MANKRSIPFLIILIFSIIFTAETHANDLLLSLENAKNYGILTGKVAIPPTETPDGFAIFTDAKTLLSYSAEGRLRFERTIKCTGARSLVSISREFLLLVTLENTLILFNSEGTLIWERAVSSDLFPDVLEGLDGRIFLHGREKVFCFSLSGICKWELSTEKQLENLPLSELNDGSILFFTEAENKDSSRAYRCSPFGEIEEVIDFDGTVSSVSTVKEGVLISFLGGKFGLSKSYGKDEKMRIEWALRERSNRNNASDAGNEKRESRFFSLNEKKSVFLFDAGSEGVKLIIFSVKGGDVLSSFTIPEAKFALLQSECSALEGAAIFVSSEKDCCIYKETGEVLWSARLPRETDKAGNISHILHTRDNHLVIFSRNWLFSVYKTIETLRGHSKILGVTPAQKAPNFRGKKCYDSFVSLDKYSVVDRSILEKGIVHSLEVGRYGAKEREYTEKVFSLASTYCTSFGTVSSPRTLSLDSEIKAKTNESFPTLVQSLLLIGGKDSLSYIAFLIRNETNPSNLRSIFNFLSLYPFDIGGSVISELQNAVRRISYRDTGTLLSLLDGAESISRVMGRKFSSGYLGEMLSTLTSIQYSDKVKKRAREFIDRLNDEK